MATKWVYLALLVSLTTLGVCFAVDDKDIGVTYRVPVTKDKIPPSDGIAHRVPVTEDKIPPSHRIAQRVPDTEDKIPPSDGIAHVVPPRHDDNIHKDSIRAHGSIPEGGKPPKQSTESNYVNDPPPGAGGRVGGGKGGGGRYCNGDDCSIGMQPIYGRHPPSPPLCQPTNLPLCQPTNPPPCPSNPPSCTPYPPCSQDCGWGGNGAASRQQPGLSGKGMRQDKENVFYDTVNQLNVAMQELTKVMKKKAAP